MLSASKAIPCHAPKLHFRTYSHHFSPSTMSRRLKDNITSSYVEAANRLASKKSRRRIVAYVESYDDVFFWRSVLSGFEDSTRYFEVMLPSRVHHLERGKKAAMMSLVNGKVGRDMIACVDADYDYLVQGRTPMSKTILESSYILHTYAYAIENLQCYAPSLHDVCVAATLNDHLTFDFEAYFRDYSLAIFPLFVWSVWFYRRSEFSDFSLADFLRVVETGHFNPDRVDETMKNLRRKVARKVAQLQRDNPAAKQSWQDLKEELKLLGVTPETTYLYIQGHHLFDKVVLPMLKRICGALVREREFEITKQSVHGTQRRNELSCYSSSVGDITFVLRKSNGYVDSEPFRRIQEDVRHFLESDHPAMQCRENEDRSRNE